MVVSLAREGGEVGEGVRGRRGRVGCAEWQLLNEWDVLVAPLHRKYYDYVVDGPPYV